MKAHIHCPVNGLDCPYYSNTPIPCQCTLEDPLHECDDFAVMWDEGDDYICHGECRGCDTCAHSDLFTTDDVACCNCCENYSFYSPAKD